MRLYFTKVSVKKLYFMKCMLTGNTFIKTLIPHRQPSKYYSEAIQTIERD